MLDGVLEAIGLGGEDKAGQRLAALRAIDKLDRLGPEGVRHCSGPGRKDESGDFTKGAGLEREAIDQSSPSRRQGAPPPQPRSRACAESVEGSARGQEGADELAEIAALVAASGYERPRDDRPVRRTRSRVLHGPGLRGRAHLLG